MGIFYFDSIMENFEKKNNYRGLIDYLENNVQSSEQNFATQICYLWNLYCEGQFISNNVSDDWEFYKNKWIKKLNYAMANYKDSSIVCFAIAYTLEISGMDIYKNLEYETKISEFYKLSEKNTNDKVLRNLILTFSSNLNYKLEKKIIKDFFPNNSLLDKYFSEILLSSHE